MVDLSAKKAVLMAGYPGSGKSSLAKKLAEVFNFQYFSSDVVRAELLQMSRFSEVGTNSHLKVVQNKQNYYDLLYQRAIDHLKDGKKIIIDATHLYTESRLAVLAKLSEHLKNQDICFINVTTPKKIIANRMSNHQEFHNPKETLFEAWHRVYSNFQSDFDKGLISWPDENLGFDIINSPDANQPFFTSLD